MEQSVSVAAAVALLLSTHAARGTTPDVTVAAPGIEGCITSERLQERVRQNVGEPNLPELVLRVEIASDEAALRARIGWFRGGELTGERVLRTPRARCEELDDALVLVATTLLEELRDGGTPAPDPPPEQPAIAPVAALSLPEPRAAPEPRTDLRPAARDTTRRPWRSSVSAGASAAAGILSDTTLSARLDVRVGVARPWALWFGLQGAPSGSARRVESSRIEFAHAMATLAACYSPVVTPEVIVDGCAGVMTGVLVTSGTAVRGSPDKVRPLVSPLVAVAVGVPLFDAMVLRGHLASGVALVRDDYFLTDSSGVGRVVRRAETGLWEAGLGLGFLL